ncbi:MAG: phosphatase PAP2 family protein [Planctomycetota bacterium]
MSSRWVWLVALIVSTPFAGCTQRWSFAPPRAGVPVPSSTADERLADRDLTERSTTTAGGSPVGPAAADPTPSPSPPVAGEAWLCARLFDPTAQRPGVELQAVFEAAAENCENAAASAEWSLLLQNCGFSSEMPTACAAMGETSWDISPPCLESAGEAWCTEEYCGEESACARFSRHACQARQNLLSDYRNYYRCDTLCDLALGLALAAPVANTSLDDDFQSWYQRDVRSRGSDDLASFWEPFGRGEVFIPAFAGLAVMGKCLEDRPAFDLCGRYGSRVTRAYLVGAPPMLLMQALLGASRPGEDPRGSQWKPFDDVNAVSGHAFMGAVPFLTAAEMCDRPVVKGGFYALSAFTAWSRVNDDAHYLSQVCLGWWMAYLACRAVNETETGRKPVRFVPMLGAGHSGVALLCEW